MHDPVKQSTLVDQCHNCYVAKHDSFHVFGMLYSAIVETLETIVSSGRHEWNANTLAAAQSLILAIVQWEFLIAFVVAKWALLCKAHNCQSAVQSEGY